MDKEYRSLPDFKVLINLIGLPPHLHNEEKVAKAMDCIGTFLGFIPSNKMADTSTMTVVLAVEKLVRIPEEVAIHVRGIQHVVSITTRNWLRSPLYSTAYLPKLKKNFSKPSPEDIRRHDTSPEPFAISKSVLLEICNGKYMSSLPSEVQQMSTLIPGVQNLLKENTTMAIVGPKSMVTNHADDDILTQTPQGAVPQGINMQARQRFIRDSKPRDKTGAAKEKLKDSSQSIPTILQCSSVSAPITRKNRLTGEGSQQQHEESPTSGQTQTGGTLRSQDWRRLV